MNNDSTKAACDWDRQPCEDGQPVRPELIDQVNQARHRLGKEADYDTVISELRNRGIEVTMEEVTMCWDPSD